MISTPDRQEAMQLIEQACAAGARQAVACCELGVSVRTLPRLCAMAPNRVWCWDTTWLRRPAWGTFFYLY